MISLFPSSCNTPKAILPELRFGKIIVFTSLSASGENGKRLSQFGIERNGCGHFAVNQDFGVFTMECVNGLLYLCRTTQAVFPEIGV